MLKACLLDRLSLLILSLTSRLLTMRIRQTLGLPPQATTAPQWKDVGGAELAAGRAGLGLAQFFISAGGSF